MNKHLGELSITQEYQADPDLEFTLWLTEADPQNPQVPEILVSRYVSDVYQLLYALLEIFSGRRPRKEWVELALVETFAAALTQLDSIRDANNARHWLFRIAVHTARRFGSRRGYNRFRRNKNKPGLQSSIWDNLVNTLEWDAVAVLILRYGFGLQDNMITYILDLPNHQAQNRLRAASQMFQVQTLSSTRDLETSIVVTLNNRWPCPNFSEQYLQFLKEQVKARVNRPGFFAQHHFPLREVVWISGILASLLLMFAYVNRQDTAPARSLFPPTPVPPPNAIYPLLDIRSSSEMDRLPTMIFPLFIGEPSLSADGDWIVFASSDNHLVPGDINGIADIYVFDRKLGIAGVISRPIDGQEVDGWSFSPVISSDGRWVVFGSWSTNLVQDWSPTCSDCSNIFLHDRGNGETRQVSISWNGSMVDGNSFSPSISPDGRWIAFWSTASNLVPGDDEICSRFGQEGNCTDLFLFDQQNSRISRVPIGSSRPYRDFGNRVSFSSDGRLLVFTVTQSMQIAIELGLETASEVVIYDQLEKTFERVNVAVDGTYGNSGSYMGAISEDGRLIAFSSSASNLVTGDDNGLDVFIKDRGTGEVSLISQAYDGDLGNGPSGVSEGGPSLFISGDGRFVTFFSKATNLVTYSKGTCGLQATVRGRFCANLYVYDRELNSMKIINQERNRPYGVLFPGIASNGRWLAFTEQMLNCNPPEVCTNAVIVNLSHQSKTELGVTSPGGSDYFLIGDSSVQQSWVNSIAFSPSGRLIASGSNDGIVRIRSFKTGDVDLTLQAHSQAVIDVAFHPDGQLLATGSHDAAVTLWRIPDGSRYTTLDSHTGLVRSLAFSPDGRYLAVGTLRAIWLWELLPEVVSLVERQAYIGEFVEAVAFSPDGKYLAFSPGDHTVWLRKTPNGAVVARLGGHQGEVKRIVFSPNGGYLAVSAEDNLVNIWKLQEKPDGELEVDYQYSLQHANWVRDMAFSPDGTTLATGSFDSTLRLWEVMDGQLVDTLFNRGDLILSLAFSPDGTSLAAGTATGKILLWEFNNTHHQ